MGYFYNGEWEEFEDKSPSGIDNYSLEEILKIATEAARARGMFVVHHLSILPENKMDTFTGLTLNEVSLLTDVSEDGILACPEASKQIKYYIQDKTGLRKNGIPVYHPDVTQVWGI